MLLLADYNVLKRMLNCFSIVYGNTKMSDTHKCGLERHYSTDYELNFQKIVENVCFVCCKLSVILFSIIVKLLCLQCQGGMMDGKV